MKEDRKHSLKKNLASIPAVPVLLGIGYSKQLKKTEIMTVELTKNASSVRIKILRGRVETEAPLEKEP